MERFGEATRRWFTRAFNAPTDVQRLGWERISAGRNTLLIAPTGSGKTLAAFLWAIDRLTSRPGEAEPGVRAVYVSPLKALVYDIERNLRAPLRGIEQEAAQLGLPLARLRIDVRTGDTSSQERQRQLRSPGGILVTTPESLFLLLGSRARETLRTVEWIIVDEIHALAGTKRGAHLALSLERLARLASTDPQRIGLSATVRPASEVARFLGGDRPVEIVDAHVPPKLDLEIIVPVEDMTRPVVSPPPDGVRTAAANGAGETNVATMPGEVDTQRTFGIWPAIYPRLLELIRQHRTTIVFVNSRGLCERLARHLNEQAGEDLVRAHHGSLAHDQRREIEEALKSGVLRAIVATSSLELGIDMGTVDLVILVESPGSAARGLQRVGRAGHAVGETSIGRIFPKHRGDLLEATVVSERMRRGEIEALHVPRSPLDVLAQHIVAMAAVEPWKVDELARVVRRAANFRELPDSALQGVLDMLSGLYPSRDFGELRPRIHWDRERNIIEGRRGARMLAAVNAGTIPDRGLYGVYMGGDRRVGELDEEMVHESQPGHTFMLGATTWRIMEITRDRVIVEPAPGEPGRLPFWKGEGPGRPLELGRAVGQFTREIGELPPDIAVDTLVTEYHLDAGAAANLVRYLEEQKEATLALPTDRDIIIERFRDELGDWRVCVLSPFGARVHAPWAMAVRAAVAERMGYEAQTIWSDDGMVLTLADSDEPPDASLLVPDADLVEERIIAELPRSPLFASQFRENAARALLLPRRRPGARTPLFAQRLRAQKLMAVALRYPSFPIVMETYRSTLQDVFDVPALREVLQSIERREVRVHEVETTSASPFARALVFAWAAAYMYEGDAPAAERRASALSLDMRVLRELLGEADLRTLLDAGVVQETEAQLQRVAAGRRARDPDEMHDVLRWVGHLTVQEADRRATVPAGPLLRELERAHRVLRVRLGEETVWIAIEDAGLYRDALGVTLPAAMPDVFLAAVPGAVQALLLRYARTHGPFSAAEVVARFRLTASQAEAMLRALAADGRLLQGRFRSDSNDEEWCDPEVLRTIKRRTMAKLRTEVSAMPRQVLGRFLPAWHGITGGGRMRLEDAVAQLEGLPLSYRELERYILPARVHDFRPHDLDALGARGFVVWVGHSPIGRDDGRIVLYRRERVGRLLVPVDPQEAEIDWTPYHNAVLQHLDRRGASFLTELLAALDMAPPAVVMDALRDLVWSGLVTNDTFSALRALAARPARRHDAGRSSRVPPAGGRWSLVRHLMHETISPTERAHAWAATLLERHGLVVRETAAIESVRGFGATYRVLRQMEEAGRVRRGYFVEGLGGAQFACPGVIDRLRRIREQANEPETVVLSATDPANPYGWLLPWPAFNDPAGASPRRTVGASVVLVDGMVVLYLDRGGHRLRTLEGVEEEKLRRAIAELRTLANHRPRNTLIIDHVNGENAIASDIAHLLQDAGFTRDYLSLKLYVP